VSLTSPTSAIRYGLIRRTLSGGFLGARGNALDEQSAESLKAITGRWRAGAEGAKHQSREEEFPHEARRAPASPRALR